MFFFTLFLSQLCEFFHTVSEEVQRRSLVLGEINLEISQSI